MLLRSEVEKRNVLENMDLMLLIMDEIVDGGVIMETDPTGIANRYVACMEMRPAASAGHSVPS